MDRLRLPLALLTAVLCAWTSAAAGAGQAHAQHDAHVHGEAELLIAVEGEVLEIELRSPAANLVGFEHRPATAAQRRALSDAVALLQQAPALFRLPAAARCEPVAAEVSSPLLEPAAPAHDHESDQAAPSGGAHSDLSAHYRYRCLAPAQLHQIGIALFEHFPGIESIQVQSISPRGQRQAELTAAQTVLEL